MKSKLFLMAVFCIVPVISLSSEVTEISIDSSTCWLKERGVAVKDDAISINGVKNESGCLAFMSKTEVAEKFSFCTYSGFEIAGGKKQSITHAQFLTKARILCFVLIWRKSVRKSSQI